MRTKAATPAFLGIPKIRPLFWNIFAMLIAFMGLRCPLVSQTPGRSESGSVFSKPVRQVSGQHRMTCSPAPCVLPNVQVSTGEAVSTIMSANPENPNQLLSGALDSQCGSEAAAYGSDDGGLSWFASCGRIAGYYGLSLAYGLDGSGYFVGSGGYNNAVDFETTQDNGHTWTQPTGAVTPIFSSGFVVTPWLAVDNSKTSTYTGRIYIATTQLDNSQVQSQISVSYSADGGTTWSTARVVDKVQVKPFLDYYSRIAVGSDGTVFAAWQRCVTTGRHVNCGGTKAHMWFSKSSDGGKSWSSPTEIFAVRLAPDSCECAFFGNLPHTRVPVANPPLLAVDNSQGTNAGNLYAATYNWTGKQMKVEIATSRDQGQSWSSPVEVAPSASNDQFFPGLSVSASGIVGVSWLDRRNDPLDALYQPFAAVSIDGGKSFGKNYRLSHTMSNPYFSGGFMGDFTGNAWSGKTLYAAWPDTRYAVLQDFVGGLRIK